MNNPARTLWFAVLVAALLSTAITAAFAQAPAVARELTESTDPAGRLALPAGVRQLRDLAYGSDREQRMDVYLPQQAKLQAAGAPVILMVHGGAWRIGDKAHKPVIENKVARWVPKGFVFVSVNYRMQNSVTPLQQAEDIARALAAAQGKAASWGADPTKFILMGHSAGAHLVALLAAAPQGARKFGAAPWLGTVALDSAALDVPQIMNARHAGAGGVLQPAQRLVHAGQPFCGPRGFDGRAGRVPAAAAFAWGNQPATGPGVGLHRGGGVVHGLAGSGGHVGVKGALKRDSARCLTCSGRKKMKQRRQNRTRLTKVDRLILYYGRISI